MIESPGSKPQKRQASPIEKADTPPSRSIQSLRGLTRSHALIATGLALAALASLAGKRGDIITTETSHPAPVVKPAPEPVEPPPDDEEFTLKGFSMRECNDQEKPKIREAIFALRGAIEYFIDAGEEEFVSNLIKISFSAATNEEAKELFTKLPQLLKHVDNKHLEIMCGTMDDDSGAAMIYEGLTATTIGIKTVPPRPESDVVEIAGLIGHEILHKNDFFGHHGNLDFAAIDGLDLPYYFGYLVQKYVEDTQPTNINE